MSDEKQVRTDGADGQDRAGVSWRRAVYVVWQLLLAAGALYCARGIFRGKPEPMPLIFTFFVLGLFFRSYGAVLVAHIRLRPELKFVLLVVLSGWLAESLAWWGNYIHRDPEPALLHPQLLPDLILAIGYYGGWAVAWLVLLRFFRFNVWEVFLTTGILALPLEQDGDVVRRALEQGVMGFVGPLFIYVVYGSIMGLGYVFVEKELQGDKSRARFVRPPWSVVKYPLAPAVAYFIGLFVVGQAFWWVVETAGMIPEKKPIWEYLWW
jgi:hypothetical protein